MGMRDINFNYEWNEIDQCAKLFYTGYKQFKVLHPNVRKYMHMFISADVPFDNNYMET